MATVPGERDVRPQSMTAIRLADETARAQDRAYVEFVWGLGHLLLLIFVNVAGWAEAILAAHCRLEAASAAAPISGCGLI